MKTPKAKCHRTFLSPTRHRRGFAAIFVLLGAIALWPLGAAAADFTWSCAAGPCNWSDPAAWTVTSGTDADGVPDDDDDVVFDATSVADCYTDAISDMASLTAAPGYTGKVTFSASLRLYGSLTCAAASQFSFSGNYLYLYGEADRVLDCPAAINRSVLSVGSSAVTLVQDVALGTILLRQLGSLNGADFLVSGPSVSLRDASNWTGDSWIRLVGTGDQEIDVQNDGHLVDIAKPSGRLTFSDTARIDHFSVTDHPLDTSGLTVRADQITVNSGGTLTGTGTLDGPVDVVAGGTLAPGASPGCLTANGDVTLAAGATLDIEVGGATACSGHDRLDVAGAVDLGGASLYTSAMDGFVPALYDHYVIVANDGSDSVVGTFAGLAEGATVSADFLGSGIEARITYQGGDGNDVVIIVGARADLSVTTHGDETGPVSIQYTVTLDQTNTTGGAITFDTAFTGGTATAGSDYANVAGPATLSVANGSATGTLTVPVADDTLFENTETAELTISNTSDSFFVIDMGTATADIFDSDNAPSSVDADLSVTAHGYENGPVSIQYTVTLDKTNDTGDVITFDTAFTGGTATAGSDYTDVTGPATLSVANGSATATLTVPVTDDSLLENTENAELTVSNPNDPAVHINMAAAMADINDNDNAPGSVNADLSVTTHGDEDGPGSIVYSVTLAKINGTGSAITFDTAFTGGTATAGSDYTDVSGPATLSVTDGSATGTLTVPVTDDSVLEYAETAELTISNPSDPAVGVNTAAATADINDNDNAPGSVNADLSVTTHGDENGPVSIQYTVTLAKTNGTGGVITFDTVFTGGTATAGSDFTDVSGAATLSVADGSATATLTVPVTDDTLFENSETAELTISNPSDPAVGVNTAAATADINDNDNAPGSVNVDLSVTTHGDETGPVSIVYTVTLSKTNDTGGAIAFDTAFTGGTATAGSDFTDVSGAATLSVADGNATATLTVPVTDDSLLENTETAELTIGNPSDPAVNVGTAAATGDIVDNDNAAGNTFTAAGNDRWFNHLNWSDQHVPLSSENATIPALDAAAYQGEGVAIDCSLLFVGSHWGPGAASLFSELPVTVDGLYVGCAWNEAGSFQGSVTVSGVGMNVGGGIGIATTTHGADRSGVGSVEIIDGSLYLYGDVEIGSVAQGGGDGTGTLVVSNGDIIDSSGATITVGGSAQSPAGFGDGSLTLVNGRLEGFEHAELGRLMEGSEGASSVVNLIDADGFFTYGVYLSEYDNCPSLLNLDRAFFEAGYLHFGTHSVIRFHVDGLERVSAGNVGVPDQYSALDLSNVYGATYGVDISPGATLEVHFGYLPVLGDSYDLMRLKPGQTFNDGAFDSDVFVGLPSVRYAFWEIVPGDETYGEILRVTVIEALFQDGFDSGDTSAWSVTVP